MSYPARAEGLGKYGNLLNIYQHIFKESKTRQKHGVEAWTDYKKAYDINLQSWIIDFLKR